MIEREIPTEQLQLNREAQQVPYPPLARAPKCGTCWKADKRWESMVERNADEWQCPYCFTWQRFGLAKITHRLNESIADAHLGSITASDPKLANIWAELAEVASHVLTTLDEIDYAERGRTR